MICLYVIKASTAQINSKNRNYTKTNKNENSKKVRNFCIEIGSYIIAFGVGLLCIEFYYKEKKSSKTPVTDSNTDQTFVPKENQQTSGLKNLNSSNINTGKNLIQKEEHPTLDDFTESKETNQQNLNLNFPNDSKFENLEGSDLISKTPGNMNEQYIDSNVSENNNILENSTLQDQKNLNNGIQNFTHSQEQSIQESTINKNPTHIKKGEDRKEGLSKLDSEKISKLDSEKIDNSLIRQEFEVQVDQKGGEKIQEEIINQDQNNKNQINNNIEIQKIIQVQKEIQIVDPNNIKKNQDQIDNNTQVVNQEEEKEEKLTLEKQKQEVKNEKEYKKLSEEINQKANNKNPCKFKKKNDFIEGIKKHKIEVSNFYNKITELEKQIPANKQIKQSLNYLTVGSKVKKSEKGKTLYNNLEDLKLKVLTFENNFKSQVYETGKNMAIREECLKKYFLEVKDPKWVKSSFFDIFKSKKSNKESGVKEDKKK